jgi:hypothetical protein
MTDLEPRPINPGLQHAEPRGLDSSDLIRRVAADITPWGAVRVGRKIAKGRMKTAVELARIEDQAVLDQARIVARAKVEALTERAESLLQAERVDYLAQGALQHEEASRLIDLVQDEVAHSLFKEALKSASARYAGGVIKRTGK